MFHKMGLGALIAIGGDGTLEIAHEFCKLGIPIVGVPKTIDNDLAETDMTFGHDSAVTTAAQALDRLYSTAEAHLRVMVIELMGHKAGWLTLAAGLAGGADIILIPEIPYDLDSICQHLTERRRRGKWFSIVAVAEGAVPRRALAVEPVAAVAAVETEVGKRNKKKKKGKISLRGASSNS